MQLPVFLIIAYLVFTLLLYVVGPFAWITYTPFQFWACQFIYIIMLFFGWQFGLKFRFHKGNLNSHKKYLLKKIDVLIIVNFIFEVINIFRRFFFNSFDFFGLLNRLIYGLQNMGESYNLYQEQTEKFNGSVVIGGTAFSFLNYLWDFLSLLIILITTLYMKKLKKRTKIILFLNYFIIFVSYISIGTNIGVFRLIFAWVVFFLISIKLKNCRKKSKKIKYVIIISAIIISSFLFISIMKSRSGILLWDKSEYNVGGIGINKDSLFIKYLPESFAIFFVAATRYLTSGYYGMSLCMTEDLQPTFGLGNSMMIVKMLRKYVTDWPYLRTYQHRIQQFGWDEDIQWHTAYSWWANDFGFLGAAIVIFVFGMLFAMAYKDAIKNKNPFAIILVYFFSLEAFFLPCNNQLFQSSYVMFSFITTFIIWMFSISNKRIRIFKGIIK